LLLTRKDLELVAMTYLLSMRELTFLLSCYVCIRLR